MRMNEVPRTLEDVARYLIKEYKLHPNKAVEIVKRRYAIYQEGIENYSFTYYIGDEMMKAENDTNKATKHNRTEAA